jgi:hypothetical protein
MPLQVAAHLTPTVRQFRRLILSAVGCGLLLTTVTDRCLAAAAEESSSLPTLHLEIQHVDHFVGLVDVKPNFSGELRCDSRKIPFVAGVQRGNPNAVDRGILD